MILDYYSNWIIPLSLIWLLLGSQLRSLFNPYYSLIVICVGYLIFSTYLLLYKKYKFNISFILIFILHYAPLHAMLSIPNQDLDAYSLETLVITFTLYTFYLASKDTDIYTVYAIDDPPRDDPPRDIQEIIDSITLDIERLFR